MKVGTRSVLFGVHQFLIHPFFVFFAWIILYRSFPKPHEFCAILTHDLGYVGKPNIDGPEGECHPETAAAWWRGRFRSFGDRVADVILGHSRFHAMNNRLYLSRLYRPDKLAIALYPRLLYLLLGNLSGEIKEYMELSNNGKYDEQNQSAKTQYQWLIVLQAHMALVGIEEDT